MVLPISLLFEQNLPPFRALSANAYLGQPSPSAVAVSSPRTTVFRLQVVYHTNTHHQIIQCSKYFRSEQGILGRGLDQVLVGRYFKSFSAPQQQSGVGCGDIPHGKADKEFR